MKKGGEGGGGGKGTNGHICQSVVQYQNTLLVFESVSTNGNQRCEQYKLQHCCIFCLFKRSTCEYWQIARKYAVQRSEKRTNTYIRRYICIVYANVMC